MNINYAEILEYLPALQDHGRLFCYYGEPADETYLEYETTDDQGRPLVMSAECDQFCQTIAADLAGDFGDYQKTLEEKGIDAEKVKDSDIVSFDLDACSALLLCLVDSLSESDLFIASLNNGVLESLLERVDSLVKKD